jgi:hypothetical protein
VNAAADGVAGALEALAHGYFKAEAALLNNHPCPGRILVRQIRDFVYRPPAASTIGTVETHIGARPASLAVAGSEPTTPPPTEALLSELENTVRQGERWRRSHARATLVVISRGGPEVPPEVQSAALAALERLGPAPR